MAFTFDLISRPFTVDAAFVAFLGRHPREYGATAAGTNTLPTNTVAGWEVRHEGVLAGYGWITDEPKHELAPGFFFSLGVLEGFQGRGALRQFVSIAEAHARELGSSVLSTQVNDAEPSGGLRLRQWLRRAGYSLAREQHWLKNSLSDDAYCQRISPVFLTRTL